MKIYQKLISFCLVCSFLLISCSFDEPYDTYHITDENTQAEAASAEENDISETNKNFTPVLSAEPVEHREYASHVSGIISKTYGELNYCVGEKELVVYFPYEAKASDIEPSQLNASGNCKFTVKNDAWVLSVNGSVFLDVICVRAHYDLPVIHINTLNHTEISSKTRYITAYMSIDSSGDNNYSSHKGIMISIRGRGNSSWRMFDKKSYRIKTNDKISLFGFSPDKDYVLISNYIDKSLMRNSVATAISKKMEHIEYTPDQINADVFLNGEYIGVYGFAEKIEFDGNKLDYTSERDVCNTSYLFEVGYNFDGTMQDGLNYFDTEAVKHIVIKEPDISKSFNEQYIYIRNYVRRAEKAIKDKKDSSEYIDIDSLIDYMIVLELTNNTESALYRSCFFYKPKDGKLKFGPVWDFDVAFGNHIGDIENYDGWCTAEATYDKLFNGGVNWFTYLMQDKTFVKLLRDRWNEKKELLLKTALDEADRQYSLLCRSAQKNFERWDIMDQIIGVSPLDPNIYNTFDSQVNYLRDFINTRYKWIDRELNG